MNSGRLFGFSSRLKNVLTLIQDGAIVGSLYLILQVLNDPFEMGQPRLGRFFLDLQAFRLVSRIRG